jgi:predicted HTH domain antitoxin
MVETIATDVGSAGLRKDRREIGYTPHIINNEKLKLYILLFKKNKITFLKISQPVARKVIEYSISSI